MKQSQENGQKPLFWRQIAEYFGDTFFFGNRASSLKIVYCRLTWCKKSEKSNGGKYEILCCRRTDRRTDGAGYIGPAEGNGGSKKMSVVCVCVCVSVSVYLCECMTLTGCFWLGELLFECFFLKVCQCFSASVLLGVSMSDYGNYSFLYNGDSK